MPRKRKISPIRIVGSLLFGAVALIMAVGLVADVQRLWAASQERSLLLETGERALAEVVSVEKRQRSYGAGAASSPVTDYLATYVFRDRQGRVVRGQVATVEIPVGAKFQVAYLPSNPSHNIVVDENVLSINVDLTELFYQGFGVFFFLVLALSAAQPSRVAALP